MRSKSSLRSLSGSFRLRLPAAKEKSLVSPANQYKKFEQRLVVQVNAFFRKTGDGLREGFARLLLLGRQKFTVMCIPHSEKKIFNFRISVFSLFFLAILVTGLLVSFFFLSTHYSGMSRLLIQKTSSLTETEANLELIRDEIAEVSKMSRAFQTALDNTLDVLGLTGSASAIGTTGDGDLSSFFGVQEQKEGVLQELSELQSLNSLMDRSVSDLGQITQILVSHKELLVELPTLWPLEGVKGRLTNDFGLAIHPFTGKLYLHKGIDLAYARGTPIIAAANGKVVERGYEAFGFGNYVRIRHNYGFYTKYAHLDTVYVEEGDMVTQGQRIGTMGSSGLSTGPHLHFEVHLGSQVVDPKRYLNIQNDLTD